MDDNMNCKAEETKKNNDRYGWIGEGVAELQEGDIEIVLKDTITIPQSRYDELVAAEAKLKILCDVLTYNKPYEVGLYRAIAGDKLMPYPKGDAEE